jgi:hypothetical protein
VPSASGDDGRKLFQHVGHRGPVYKGLGAMNPCDHLHLPLNNIFIGFHGCVVVAESGCSVNVLSSFLKNLCYVSEIHFSSHFLYS